MPDIPAASYRLEQLKSGALTVSIDHLHFLLASFLLKIIKQQRSKRTFTYTALDISYENRLSLFHYRACLSGYPSHCSDVPVTSPTIAIKSTQIKALLENLLILCL